MDWSKLNLSGNRTYVSAAALIAVGLLSLSGQIDQQTTQSLGALAVAALGVYLRAAIAKMPKEQRDRVERAIDLMDEIREALKASGGPAAWKTPEDKEAFRKLWESTVAAKDEPPSVRLAETPVEYVERVEPRSLDPNFPPPPPTRLQTLRDLSDDSIAPRVVLMLAAVLSLAACANAAAPRAIITGPNTGTPGEFLTLDASTSEGDPKHFRWSIAPELRGRKQLLPSLTGERCTVASFPGRYLVTLAVANDDGIDSLTWQIEIPGNAPCPPPEPQPVTPQPIVPPGPTPIPQPVNPVTPVNPQPVDNTPGPGEFNIAPAVYQAAKAATSPTRVQDCQRLASECRRIASGSADSLNAVATQMVAVLVTLPAGWDALKAKVKTTVATLAVSGRVKSAADLQRLLLELADAFERAAK